MSTQEKKIDIDSSKISSFSSIISKSIKMEAATIQKLRIDTLFHSTKVAKLMSLEFNIDFIYQGVPCCMLNDTFLNVKPQQL